MGTNAFYDTDNVVGFTDHGSQVRGYVDTNAAGPNSYTRSGTFTITSFSLFGLTRTVSTEEPMAGRIYALLAYNRVLDSTERAAITTLPGAKMGRTLQ